MSKKIIAFGITSGVSLAVGSVAGYLYARKVFKEALDEANDYIQQAERELDEAHASMDKVIERLEKTKKQYKQDEYATPEKAAERLVQSPLPRRTHLNSLTIISGQDWSNEGVEAAQGGEGDIYDIPEDVKVVKGRKYRKKQFDLSPEEKKALKDQAMAALEAHKAETADPAEVIHNVFKGPPNPRVGGEEMPKVISQEEFLQNETDYNQTTIFYYMGDQVLVDERDQPIEDIAGTVGVENLDEFGHHSNDKHVVYIQNHRLQTEFELIRNMGKYSEDVLGFGEGHEIRSHRQR